MTNSPTWLDPFFNASNVFVTNLSTRPPDNARARVWVDGYSSVGDGGQGTFYWDATYNGPATALDIYPTGLSPLIPGAWRREIGSDRTLLATWFGAKGDATSASGFVVTGTDDTAAIQAMLDYNVSHLNLGPNSKQYKCKLPTTRFQFSDGGLTTSRTGYRITRPLQYNDDSQWFPSIGNSTQVFEGQDKQAGLVAYDFVGPAVIMGNCGDFAPVPLLDPSGSGEWVMVIGNANNMATLLTSASNGAVWPVTTLHVTDNSTTEFPPAGQIVIQGAARPILVNYTGTTTGTGTTTFTGCSSPDPQAVGLVLHTGYQIATVALPQWNIADYEFGDVAGLGAFCVEYFINPNNATTYVQSRFPGGGYASSILNCSGQLGDGGSPVAHHRTFYQVLTNSATNPYYQFFLTTTGGSVVVQSSSTTDQTPAANTLSHIAFDYDGAHLRMFIAGQQPSGGGSTFTQSITGTLAKAWYEHFVVNAGLNEIWPFIAGNAIYGQGPPQYLGRIRVSKVSRYGAGTPANGSPFTPPAPSTIVKDSNTLFYMDFTPTSFPSSRPSLGGYNLASCGTGILGGTEPIWMYNRTSGANYRSNGIFKNMPVHSQGEGVHAFAQLYSEIGESCDFMRTRRAITFDTFSYNSAVGKNCSFLGTGAASVNPGLGCMTCDVFFSVGSQIMEVKENWLSANGACNVGIVAVFSDTTVRKGFPGGYYESVYAFAQSVSKCTAWAGPIDDQIVGGYGAAGILWLPTKGSGGSLDLDLGFVEMANSTGKPVVLVGAPDTPVRINMAIFGTPAYVVSFQGRAAVGADGALPVQLLGPPAQIAAICDPSNPGPVQIPSFLNGYKTLTFPSDADYTLSTTNGDAHWGTYLVATGVISTTRKITWPKNPGQVFQLKNLQVTQSIQVLVTGSSSPVTITAGSKATLYNTGVDLVAF